MRPCSLLPLALVLILVLVGASKGIGRAVCRVSAVNVAATTVLLGIMPGGASSMVAVAYDLGASPSLVAAMHSVRPMIVFGALPLALRRFSR